MVTPAAGPVGVRREVAFLLGYFALYLCYLFAYQESESVHWLTLVALPLVLIGLLRPRTDSPIRYTLASVGLSTSTWKNGLSWAVPLGIVLSLAQLIVSNRSADFVALIRSGDALYLFPFALVFLLMTAGFTEEFFFRGVIQTRLGIAWRSKARAVLATSVLFGLYHVPYAYFNPNWGSYGQWDAAIISAMSQGIVGGLILGAVYERAGRNLLASIMVHALINALPAMTMIKFN